VWSAGPLNVLAEDQTGKVHRIGYLASRSAAAATRFVEAFRQGLRELGWVEGQNIVVEYRFADGNFDRLPNLAADLVRELLKEAVPKIQRVAILSNPANPIHDLARSDVKNAARLLGLQLQLLEVRGPEGFDGSFAAVTSERAEALFVVADSTFFIHRERLAVLAERNRLHKTQHDAGRLGATWHSPCE
jgi:hypothetical protein